MKTFNKSNIKNILIVRLSSLGDVLLTTPMIKDTKSAYPNATVNFVVQNTYEDIIKYNPNIDQLFLYDRNFSEEEFINFKNTLTENLPHKKYDIVFDLQKNRRSQKITKGISETIRKVDKRRLAKLLLVNFKVDIFKLPIMMPDVYRNTGSDYFEKESDKLEFWLKGEKDYKKEKFSIPPKKIGFAPGSQHFTKRWLPTYFGMLGKLLHKEFKSEIHIFGSKEEQKYAIEIEDFVNIYDHTGKYTIYETAEIIDEMDLFITNDSGLQHVAAARQIPTISIFGSSSKKFGFTPYGTKSLIIENNDINCRPCSHIGRAKCPKGHFRCMIDLSPELVLGDILSFLDKIK